MAKASLNIKIIGLKEALDKVKSDFKKKSAMLDAEMGNTMEKIALEAKQNLPNNFSQLRASINVKKIGEFNYTIGSNMNYAAYVEFGTGKYAANYVPTLEPEWQRFAETYIVNRKGKTRDYPYLYPAFQTNIPILIKKIQEIVNKDVR
jgi:HK97 gp10 family phage protein